MMRTSWAWSVGAVVLSAVVLGGAGPATATPLQSPQDVSRAASKVANGSAWEVVGFGDVDGQAAEAGERFAHNLRNQVHDAAGVAVPDERVRYEIRPTTGGMGSYFSTPGQATADVISDSNGMTEAPPMFAGGTAGAFEIRVSLPDASSGNTSSYHATVLVTALHPVTITAPQRHEIAPVTTLAGSAEPGAAVRLVDTAGNAIAGANETVARVDGSWSIAWRTGERDEPYRTVIAKQTKNGKSGTSDAMTLWVKQVLITGPDESANLSHADSITVRGVGIPGGRISIDGCTVGSGCTYYGYAIVSQSGEWSLTKAGPFITGDAYILATDVDHTNPDNQKFWQDRVTFSIR